MTSVMLLMFFKLFLLCLLLFIDEIESGSTSNSIPCRDGWYLFGEKCYKVFGQNSSRMWIEAREICNQQDGHLASIYSKELQDFLNTFLLLSAQSNLYIGLNDRAVKRVFQWDDGSGLNYTNWMVKEPNSPQENCVEMRFWPSKEFGKWNDVLCTNKLPFICQTNKSEEVFSPDPRFCTLERGGGWMHLNSCYHVIEEDKKSWDDAEKICQDNFKGNLVTIGDPTTEKFLNGILSNNSMDFWIGLKLRDGTLKWSSGLNLVFHNWKFGQQLIKGNCGMRTKLLYWIHIPCSQKHPFICETSSSKLPDIRKTPSDWTCPNVSSAWLDFDGDTCYIFETKRSVKWNDAKYACMMKGGALTKILSEDESRVIHRHVMHTQERLFIGLHRSSVNTSVMEWIDGTEMEYQKWLAGQPDNYLGGEFCGEILTSTMEWNDVTCEHEKGYICSAKKLPPNITKENELSLHNALNRKKSECAGEATFVTVMITVVCTTAILMLIGVGIYFFKTRHIQPSSFVRFVS